MNRYLSDKICVLSFMCILIVLYAHSSFHEYPHEIAGMKFNYLLQKPMSDIFGRCALQLFFAISGYLFFLNTETGLQAVWHKMKKRTKTLLIPYLIACPFLPLFYILMEMIPGTEKFVNSGNFIDNLSLPLDQLLKCLFFDSGYGKPWAFHLWFLRDLMIIVFLSPLLYIIRKSNLNRFLVCAILFGLTFVDIPYLPAVGIFWFMLGTYFLKDFIKIPYRNVLTIVFILSSIAEAILSELGWNVSFFQIPIALAGVICIWLWYDKLVPDSFDLKQCKWLRRVCGFTFLIYLYHEPTINIIRKLLVLPFGHNSFSFAFSYLLSPWVFVLVSVFIGMLMKRYMPWAYKYIVGGR